MRTLMWIFAVVFVAGAGYFIWRGRQERLGDDVAKRDALKRAQSPGVRDMRKCAKCGAYVPTTDAKPCGQAECPAALSLPKSESESRSGGGTRA